MKRLVFLMLIYSGLILGLKEGSELSVAQVAQEGKGCSAPKEWGQLKGVADRAVAFEDSSGTIRVLDLGPCMRGETQLIVKINRQ
jgi:hypothetical protein